jgi:HSF-type DNA-binding
MSYDKDVTKSGNCEKSSLPPVEITPLHRSHEMKSGDHGTRSKQKDAGDGPDMYPGFGRLSPNQLNSYKLALKGDRLGSDSDEDEVHHDHPLGQIDDRKVAVAPKKTRASRKRRRSEDDINASKAHHETSYVHHEYHDFSGLSGGAVALPILRQKGRGGVSSMFPTVLHHMLEVAERQNFSHIVSWQPHGRAFHVHMPEKFVAEVMPNYFRHTRLSSFQRQLSLYGFTRLARKGPDRGGK